MSPTPTGEQGIGSGLLLELRDLVVAFPTKQGIGIAVNGVSLEVERGQILGIVGESGSGKTMLCRAILGLIPWPGSLVSGSVLWRGEDIAQASRKQLNELRGTEISMIFQDPASVLDPVFTVGDQISETLRVHRGMSRRRARQEAQELLGRVGIPSPRERYGAYPHQLSGGMRQRAMIAIAISCQPSLILADEPTTNLDVTIQDQILRLLDDLRDEYGMAMILVSHDLGVIAQTADVVNVMYAGSVVETAPVRTLFTSPAHPYTEALFESLPSIDLPDGDRHLASIPGQPPSIHDEVVGCPFASRCRFAAERCSSVDMALIGAGPSHRTACPFHRVEESAAHG
jgi:oligopeptide/dipeptide ABC transporter ATP-binding protein